MTAIDSKACFNCIVRVILICAQPSQLLIFFQIKGPGKGDQLPLQLFHSKFRTGGKEKVNNAISDSNHKNWGQSQVKFKLFVRPSYKSAIEINPPYSNN